MNLSLIAVLSLFCYKLLVSDNLLAVFELNSIPLIDSKPTPSRGNFSILELGRKLTQPEIPLKDTTGRTLIKELNFSLGVDKPDLLFQSSNNDQVMLAYVTQIDAKTSNLTLKTIDFSNHGTESSRKLYATKCLEMSFPGKIVELKYQSSRLMVKSLEQENQTSSVHEMIRIIQSLDCIDERNTHTRGRYMIRDDAMVLRTNISKALGEGRRLYDPILVQDTILGMTEDKSMVAIEPALDKTVPIVHSIQECQGIVKFQAVSRWIVLVCYRATGLKVETSIVVASTGGGRYRPFMHLNNGDSLRLIKVSSRALTSHTKWKSMDDYLSYANMIQIEASQEFSSVVVAVKKQAIWITPSDFKIEITGKEIPLKYTDKLTFGLDGAAHFVAAYTTGETRVVIQDAPNSYNTKIQDQLAVFEKEYFKDILVDRSSSTRTACIITLDDSNGITLYRIADQLAPHQSMRMSLDLIGRCAASWSELAIYCYLFRVFVGFVYRLWNGEVWSKTPHESTHDLEKEDQKRYITELHESLRKLSANTNASLLTHTRNVVVHEDSVSHSIVESSIEVVPIEPYFQETLQDCDHCYIDSNFLN